MRSISEEEYALMPEPTFFPLSSKITTASPRSKCPVTPATPAGNRLLSANNAWCAPLSIKSLPSALRLFAIHRFRAVTGELCARNQVHLASASRSIKISPEVPSAIITLHPAAVAIFAASIFVFIPPEPMSDRLGPAIDSMSFVISPTTPICSASASSRGSAVYKPSMSLSKTNKSAFAISATRDANLSLSPNLISSVATVSFSLIKGIAPR